MGKSSSTPPSAEALGPVVAICVRLLYGPCVPASSICKGQDQNHITDLKPQLPRHINGKGWSPLGGARWAPGELGSGGLAPHFSLEGLMRRLYSAPRAKPIRRRINKLCIHLWAAGTGSA